MDDSRERFERAFVATSYLLGARGDALGSGGLGPAAVALVRALSSPDQATRARALAGEMARLGRILDEGAIV